MNYFKDEKYDLAQALMSLVLGMLTLQLGLWAGRQGAAHHSPRGVPVNQSPHLVVYRYTLAASSTSSVS